MQQQAYRELALGQRRRLTRARLAPSASRPAAEVNSAALRRQDNGTYETFERQIPVEAMYIIFNFGEHFASITFRQSKRRGPRAVVWCLGQRVS